MIKLNFIIILLIPIVSLVSNPIPVYTFHGPDIDYLRGTIGEIISNDDYNITEYGTLSINNELRYIWYKNPIPLPSDYPSSNPPYYFGKATGRLTYLFNADMGFKRFDIGLRIPYIVYSAENPTDSMEVHKISDLLIKIRFEPFTDGKSAHRVNFGLGIKFPTGDNESALPSSPGSRDYCLWTNISMKQGKSKLNLHFGYIYTGKFIQEVYVYNSIPHAWEYEELEFDAGNLINLCLGINFDINRFTGIQVNMELIKGFEIKSTDNRNYVLITGFSKLSLSPIINFRFPDLNIKTEIGMDLPLAHDYYLSGTELFFRLCYSPKLF